MWGEKSVCWGKHRPRPCVFSIRRWCHTAYTGRSAAQRKDSQKVAKFSAVFGGKRRGDVGRGTLMSADTTHSETFNLNSIKIKIERKDALRKSMRSILKLMFQKNLKSRRKEGTRNKWFGTPIIPPPTRTHTYTHTHTLHINNVLTKKNRESSRPLFLSFLPFRTFSLPLCLCVCAPVCACVFRCVYFFVLF